ncbi:hypothetical protein D3C78_1342270 [compost metagenome]
MARAGSPEEAETANIDPAASLVEIVGSLKAICFSFPTKPVALANSLSLPGLSDCTVIKTLPAFIASCVEFVATAASLLI